MLPLPTDLQARFEKLLPVNGVPEKAREFYLRWLRFYLDYCRKYDIPFGEPESHPLFLQKLQEKKLPPWQQEQASHAVSLYFDLIPAAPESVSASAPIAPAPGPAPATNPTPAPVSESTASTGASWREEFTSLTQEIKLRHYSPKTLVTYKLWLRKFQAFVRSKPPESLTAADVKEFLTWLAGSSGRWRLPPRTKH